MRRDDVAACLIGPRSLGAIDYEVFDPSNRRLQPESQLFLERGEQRRSRGVDRWRIVGPRSGGELARAGRPIQFDVEDTLDLRAIDHRCCRERDDRRDVEPFGVDPARSSRQLIRLLDLICGEYEICPRDP